MRIFSKIWLILLIFFVGCETKNTFDQYHIAVFVPGHVAGSPTYEMLVKGARRAVAEHKNAKIKVIEAGFAQSKWAEKLRMLVATGRYKLILTSNPAMPTICNKIAKNFPQQKFVIMDASFLGNKQIYCVFFNKFEQAYLLGYLAGLVTQSNMSGANPQKKVGMIIAQRYPIMNRAIIPGFQKGLEGVDPKIRLDIRVIGNWSDAVKALDLTKNMIEHRADVIFTIAGVAMQGVIKAAKKEGKYVLWFDSNGYAKAPGTIIGSGILRQEKATYETVKAAIEGRLVFGKTQVYGVKEGYVDFVENDPLYIQSVPEKIRKKLHQEAERLRNGRLHFSVKR